MEAMTGATGEQGRTWSRKGVKDTKLRAKPAQVSSPERKAHRSAQLRLGAQKCRVKRAEEKAKAAGQAKAGEALTSMEQVVAPLSTREAYAAASSERGDDLLKKGYAILRIEDLAPPRAKYRLLS